MAEAPLARGEDAWRWTDPRVDVDEAFEDPTAAVEAGAEALRRAVEEGQLSAEAAREVASEARFALGGHEHHLGGGDRGAFQRLAELEDELADAG
jgi:hypothetical protein